MDNKTHMMFHDQDIREETTAKNFAIYKRVISWMEAGESNEEITAKLKNKYNLDDTSIHQLLS